MPEWQFGQDEWRGAQSIPGAKHEAFKEISGTCDFLAHIDMYLRFLGNREPGGQFKCVDQDGIVWAPLWFQCDPKVVIDPILIAGRWKP